MRSLSAIAQFLTSPKAPPAWAWPAAMLIMGLAAVAASLVFYPGGDEWTYIFGRRFGAGCTFLEATGYPCPSCGMTRSWVHLARGDVMQAFSYNAAGAILLLWLAFAGVLGGVRLVLRDPRKWQLPYNVVAGFALFWMIVPYLGLWLARCAGFNPLP